MESKTFDKKTVDFENKEILEYLERLYMDVTAKKDVVTNVFDSHKYDVNGDVITGEPFQVFMKDYVQTKFEYDTLMKKIQDTYIPLELQEAGCNWEVNFDNETIIITPLK